MEEQKPKIIGTVRLVICAECKLTQDWVDVLEEGRCVNEKRSRGWAKCYSTEFHDIAGVKVK